MQKFIAMGRLTKDPEMRYTATQVPVCGFSIAVDRSYVKQGEERQADFFNCTAWSNTGEFVNKYFKKGNKILIEGELQNNNYEDNNGVKHYSMNINVGKVYFVESKNSGSGENNTANTNKQQGKTEGFFPTEEDDQELPF
jgi:single-strand DNA-binding protein